MGEAFRPDAVLKFHRRASILKHLGRDIFLQQIPKSPIAVALDCTEHGSMNRPHFPANGSSSLRKGRASEMGRIYLVTFNTFHRVKIFQEWRYSFTFARALHSRSLLRQSRLLSWVLMPDHWHGLLELGAADTLSTLVGRIKGATANAVNVQRNCRDRVWAEGFHDRALRREEDLLSIARYVVLNPVRAGLVTRIAEYPFWDAIWLREQ